MDDATGLADGVFPAHAGMEIVTVSHIGGAIMTFLMVFFVCVVAGVVWAKCEASGIGLWKR